jgi:hypothetical protein
MSEMSEQQRLEETWWERYAPDLHPAIRADYQRLKDTEKPHLQELQTADREQFPHMDGKNTVLRIEPSWGDVEYQIERAANFRTYLGAMREQWGIPTLEPQYVVGQSSSGEHVLYVFVEKIEEAVDFAEVVKTKDATLLAQYDELTTRLCAMFSATLREGGTVYPEVFRLDQYVVRKDSTDALPVCVDVSPEFGSVLEPNMTASTTYALKGDIEDSLRWLVEDSIHIKRATDGAGVRGTETVAALVAETLEAGLLRQDAAERLRFALEASDPSPVDVNDEWWDGEERVY